MCKFDRLRAIATCSSLCLLIASCPAIAQEKPAADGAVVEKDKAQKKGNKGMRVVPAAQAFLESLDDSQRETASFEFDTEKRVKWHFIPMETRKGLPVMEMKEEQKTVAMQLLRSALSQAGYNKATKIMQLESILLKLEGPESEGRRNPEKYYFSIFGTPKYKQRWGLSVEGHHLSLNFVFDGSKVIDSTPQFFATNPAELKEDFGEGFAKGLKVLGPEEGLGFKLVKSLSEDQMAKATLPGETPAEIRGAGEPQPPTDAAQGIAASDLTDEQQEMLKKLMKVYTAKMKPQVSQDRWKLIDDAGFEKVKFGWSGAKRPGIGHYYVVQGPTFVIEFINVQPDAAGNPANHVHCVWRDMQGDFDLPIASK